MKTLTAIWTGIRPMLMQNVQMLDPTHPLTKRIKEIQQTRSKDLSDTQREEIKRLEWEGGCYWDETIGFYIPSDNIEKCIREGASKSRKGKDFAAALLVSEPRVPVTGIRYPKDIQAVFEKPEFKLQLPVRIPPKTGARVLRLFPIIPVGWKLEFHIEYDENTIKNDEMVKRAMDDAGALVGLGTWRPKYGRFTVELGG